MMAAFVCLLSTVNAPAAESRSEPSWMIAAQPLFSVSALKERLFRLRDLTASAIAPLQGAVDASELTRIASAIDQFDSRRQLFTPLGRELYSDRLARFLKQRWGVQVRTNVLLQYELARYRSSGDGREVGVKLELHYEFQ